MAFDWIGEWRNCRSGRGAVPSFVTAITLTIAMVGAVSTSLGVRTIRVGSDVSARFAQPYERLTYAVATRPSADATQAIPGPEGFRAAPTPATRVDTATTTARASSQEPSARAATALDARPPDPRLRPPLPRRRAELRLPTYDVTRILTSEQRDSALRDLSMSVPVLAADLKPTQEISDSLARAEASRAAFYRDQVRPMPIPLGGASIALFGKSREERRRDSIVHADNSARLQRLIARVRAKQDSARRADSIAALKTQRVDSTDE